MSFFKRFSKLRHYQSGLNAMWLPQCWHERQADVLDKIYSALSQEERFLIDEQVCYYCKSSDFMDQAPELNFLISDLKYKGHASLYYVDFIRIMRLFSNSLMMNYEFGDVTHVPNQPTFVKSRPISERNHNSVLLKLNSFRHYYHEPDRLSFEQKKPGLVWRGVASQAHRVEFLEQYYGYDGWDVGCTSKHSQSKNYHVDPLTLQEQMQYQFILSIEGNDVATNLKWIMASNSVCVMRKPRFETWYREGQLIPDYHYILVRDDYSDMPDKLAYYAANPDKAKIIGCNANAYFKTFLNVKRERLLNYLVAKRYFDQYQ